MTQSEFGSDWLKKFIKIMLDIIADKGAVGVAAPQIGISKRVIVFVIRLMLHDNLGFGDQAYKRPDDQIVEMEQDLKIMTPVKKARGQEKIQNSKHFLKLFHA
ncbi:peptide deformylase [Legionella maceachernii]|uniref:peptide deformylase n=1 Tax=Legionella maceachernii TaxID=466 RepID=UPI001F42CA07|nr:peptide deformylase [Legionella maceachernii]